MRVIPGSHVHACSPIAISGIRIMPRFTESSGLSFTSAVTRLGHAPGPSRQRARGISASPGSAHRSRFFHPLRSAAGLDHSDAQQIGQPDVIARRSFVAPHNAAGYLRRWASCSEAFLHTCDVSSAVKR